uniref:BRCT domain-containing protein n=1 Tax=Plectus sambesii TaxID=2011161 RepID=A0A914XIK6_9BILA
MAVPSNLFQDVQAYLVPSTLDQAAFEETSRLLSSNGARLHNFITEGINLVVADQGNAPEVVEARETFRVQHVVTTQWVRVCVQLGCTVNPRPFAPERRQIFAGITMAMTQLPPLDLHRLWALAVAHGAKCERVLTKKTTHLICGSCTGKKFEVAVNSGLKRIVSPNWLVDSVLKLTIQDESRYPPVASTARPVTLPTTTDAQAIHDLAASLKHEASQLGLRPQQAGQPQQHVPQLPPGAQAPGAFGQHAQHQRPPPLPPVHPAAVQHPNSPLEPLDPHRF